MSLSPEDTELLFSLARDLTGAKDPDSSRRWLKISRIEERMKALGCSSFSDYLATIEIQQSEYDRFISMMTIHTTSWFREPSHFDAIRADIRRRGLTSVRILSAACSTGQECYSLAMVLETFRAEQPGFDYEILGFDIDPVSIATAREGMYPVVSVEMIPEPLRGYVEPLNSDVARVKAPLMERCRFFSHALQSHRQDFESQFDYVLCRNVLIYFDRDRVKEFGDRLLKYVRGEGLLIVGHSEALPLTVDQVTTVAPSIYRKEDTANVDAVATSGAVLFVDASGVLFRLVESRLREMNVEAMHVRSLEEGATPAAQAVRVAVLCGERFGENQVRALKKISGKSKLIALWVRDEGGSGVPESALEAFKSGDLHEVKTRTQVLAGVDAFSQELRELLSQKTRKALKTRSHGLVRVETPPEVLLFGASTGGPEALQLLLKDWPKTSPPLVVVQHMQPEFLRSFAEALARSSGLRLNLGDRPLVAGDLAVPWDQRHLHLIRKAGTLWVSGVRSPPRHGHIPSVDELFFSASKVKGAGVATLLTGMGKDGAAGLLELSRASFLTMAQSKESCVVYGMPKEAMELGAVQIQGSIPELRATLLRQIQKSIPRLAG